MNKIDMQNRLKEMIAHNLPTSEARVFLFGSWARGQERQSSDIDIGLWYENEMPAGALSRLRMAIEESNIPYKVDIIDLTKCDGTFREKVMKEGQEWIVWSKE